MGRFDGVAVMLVDRADSADAGAAGPAPTVTTGTLRMWLTRRGHRGAEPRPGVPGTLCDADGRHLVTVGLRAGAGAPDGLHPEPAGHGACAHDPQAVAGNGAVGVAVLPPASIGGLVGCRPLAGGRTHVAMFGHAMTICGRLPAGGEPLDPGRVDCLRCRRSDELRHRFARQLREHDRLLALLDPLTAAALAGWWPRLDHHDPGDLPVLLDAMAGARLHGLPGAPDTDEVLRQVRRHRTVASAAVRAWAAAQARPRLEAQLRRLLLGARGPGGPDDRREVAVRRELTLAGALLDPADVAETLVALLERHGPAPSLEPVVLEIARRAGETASDRVQRWRRLHAVAAALHPGPHRRSPRSGTPHRTPIGTAR